MTNIVAIVLLSKALITETNSVGCFTPDGSGVMSNITVITSEVLTFTNESKLHSVTNPVKTNRYAYEFKEIIPELPIAHNQPHKP